MTLPSSARFDLKLMHYHGEEIAAAPLDGQNRRVDTPTAGVIIFGSAALLAGVSAWVGWKRYTGRLEELPAPLRGRGFIVTLIGTFIVAMVALLAYGIASNWGNLQR